MLSATIRDCPVELDGAERGDKVGINTGEGRLYDPSINANRGCIVSDRGLKGVCKDEICRNHRYSRQS